MHPIPIPRPFPFIAILVSASFAACQVVAAVPAPRTEMAPFKVEAEFGIDGLRIQNSNSVLNQHLLSQHGVATLQDVAGIAPNLFTSNSDSRGFGDVLTLRGVANSIFFSPPAVGLYIDDVPGGSVSSYPSTLLTIDSLAVKAGPQGTEYGRNAPAGVIEVTTRAPGSQHRGDILVDVGSFNSTAVQAAFDGPVGGQLGYSAAIGYASRDGYIDNTFLKRSADDRKSLTGRGALTWKPNDTLQLRFGVVAEKTEDDATRLSSLFSPDAYRVASDLNGETRIDRRQLSFQARQTFNWGVLTSTTSWQTWDLDPATTDLDLNPMPAAFSRLVQSEDMWTQEVRVESLRDASRPQWRAGVFYFNSEIDGDALRQFAVPPSQFVPPGFVQTERTRFGIGQESLAGYASVEQPVAEKTTVKLGARLERTESDLDRTKAASNNFGFPGPQDPRLTLAQDHTYLSGTVGLVHSVSDSISLQVRSSIAFKPEGYSGFSASPQLARFDDERSWANEVGITFGPPQGRFGGSLMGFWSAIDGYQYERTVPNSTDFVVVNAQEVRSQGIEGKFMFNPVERVWWDFQAGYTRATFESHRDAAGVSMKGRRVPFVPEYTLRTGLTADLGRGLSANASYAAIGRTFFNEQNTAMFSQPTYGIISAQLRYRFDRWTATVYGQNLADKQHYQFINPEIYAGSPGAPRRFGVQFSFSY